jgi:hypothetical protein
MTSFRRRTQISAEELDVIQNCGSQRIFCWICALRNMNIMSCSSCTSRLHEQCASSAQAVRKQATRAVQCTSKLHEQRASSAQAVRKQATSSARAVHKQATEAVHEQCTSKLHKQCASSAQAVHKQSTRAVHEQCTRNKRNATLTCSYAANCTIAATSPTHQPTINSPTPGC